MAHEVYRDVTRRSFLKTSGILAASALLGIGSSFFVACSVPGPDPVLTEASSEGLSFDMIERAAGLLEGTVSQTPLIPARALSDDRDIWLKLENLQNTGSFKLRGAYTMMALLEDAQKTRGVVTCSAGNHAQGVAYAAQEQGLPATIFIPASAPQSKIEATLSYGATVQLVDGSFDEAKSEAEAFVAAQGGAYIPPYDDYRIMAGQGTVGLEILEQAHDVDAVIVPIGGGGLIAGIAYAMKSADPSIAVYGVEPEAMPSMSVSLAAGYPTAVESKESLADGLRVARPGDKTFELVRNYVDDVVTVTEDEIADAIAYLASREKIVAEGAGAVSVAAVMAGAIPLGSAKKAVCVISGGNIDAGVLGQLLATVPAK